MKKFRLDDLEDQASSDALIARFCGRQASALSVRVKTRRRKAETFLEGIKIVEAESGKVLVSKNVTQTFNPASNTKLATALAVLRKFGSEFRFKTEVRHNGTVNDKGELTGDLFVSGTYMLFGDRHAKELRALLIKKGITSVTGDLYVSPNFSMNLEDDGLAAGRKLMTILDPEHGPASRKRQKSAPAKRRPRVASFTIKGKLKVGYPTEDTLLTATHNSPPTKDILKICLCYSNNEMAERFGEMIGGAKGLTDFVIREVGAPASEVSFASTSGLYVNRVSPRAMLMIVSALRDEAKKNRLALSDLCAVAGIDDGTLKHRFAEADERGSVIAKTGTLPQTDQGVSTLSGELHTKTGTYLFVIFHMHGDVSTFRHRQDSIVTQFQDENGDAKAIAYTPILPRIDKEDFWQ